MTAAAGSSAGAAALGAATGGAAMGSIVANAQTFGALTDMSLAFMGNDTAADGGGDTAAINDALRTARLGFGHPSRACARVNADAGAAALGTQMRAEGLSAPTHVLRNLWKRQCDFEEACFWAGILVGAFFVVHWPLTRMAAQKVTAEDREAYVYS